MFNIYLYLNRIGNEASKWSNNFCPSIVPSLDLSCDKSIVNGNSLPISTTDISMLVLSTGPAFKYYDF